MKIIALLPVKNESWVLKSTLPQLRRFVDDIIVLDGQSTDGSQALVQQFGGTVIRQEGDQARYSHWRQTLLEAARARGGTHLVWLDADEAFTSNFLSTFRVRLQAMKPGQKLILDWLCLWKDARQLRVDDSVWSVNPKDFVYCDDLKTGFLHQRLHEGRTPGPNSGDAVIRIPRAEGAVLHFQFVPFDRFQIKQVFMQCREWNLKTAEAWKLNEKYGITHDDPHARCQPITPEWLEGIPGLDDLRTAGPGWYQEGVLNYFQQQGPECFEPLDIWHIPQFREFFRQRVGRDPQPEMPPTGLRRWVLKAASKIRRTL